MEPSRAAPASRCEFLRRSPVSDLPCASRIDRDDETTIGLHGDPEVDRSEGDDLVGLRVEVRVEPGKPPQRADAEPQDEREGCHLAGGRPCEVGPHRHESGCVGGEPRRRHGRLVMGPGQPFRRDAVDPGERHVASRRVIVGGVAGSTGASTPTTGPLEVGLGHHAARARCRQSC